MRTTMPHALYGDGPSKVIALHGWLGDRHAFDALVPSLDQRTFTFAIPDIRGYGNLKQQPAKQIGPATPSGCPTTRTKGSRYVCPISTDGRSRKALTTMGGNMLGVAADLLSLLHLGRRLEDDLAPKEIWVRLIDDYDEMPSTGPRNNPCGTNPTTPT